MEEVIGEELIGLIREVDLGRVSLALDLKEVGFPAVSAAFDKHIKMYLDHWRHHRKATELEVRNVRMVFEKYMQLLPEGE